MKNSLFVHLYIDYDLETIHYKLIVDLKVLYLFFILYIFYFLNKCIFNTHLTIIKFYIKNVGNLTSNTTEIYKYFLLLYFEQKQEEPGPRPSSPCAASGLFSHV